ncbi:MAG: DUF2207 domain-containing protein [Saprospiraceae bacterium]|nr:DUF2207 domain-containing protein [Saprospiraceae bacterium]
MNPKYQFLLLLIFFFSIHLIQAQDMDIERFHVFIDVETDGSFKVREEIDVRFLQDRRGIIRSIPTRNIVNGEEVKIDVTEIKVPDWNYKILNSRNGIDIRIGDLDVFLIRLQKYVIEYRVWNAFIHASDHSEFFWNLTGNDWGGDISNLAFEINLPDEIGSRPFEYDAFTGLEGIKGDDFIISHEGKSVKGATTKTLEPGEGISVVINLPKGLITENVEIQNDDSGNNQKVRDTRSSDRSEGGYPFLPAALLALLFGAYRRHGINQGTLKDEEIKEKYYPPEDMNPAEVGTFYDFTVHSRDLIALIPKWGNQGCVEVRSIPDHKGDPELYFYKLKRLPLDTPQYELDFFNDLFKNGDQVFIGDLKNKFYQDLSKAKSRVNKEIKSRELYDFNSMQYFKRWPNIVGFILCLIGGILLMVIANMFITGGMMILIAVILLVFLIRRPKLTEKGLSLHNDLRGFYKFLKNPKPSKLNQLIKQDEQYLEKVFPYVVAFGLDKTWNKNISSQYPDYTPPPWYYYQNVDGTRRTATSWSDFGTSFNVKTINSVFSSAPQSTGSSSGGFSGGSSGGGFGGGGGSSW